MAGMLQQVKSRLVRLGPNHGLVQAALKFHCLRHGYKVRFLAGRIMLRKANRELVLNNAQYVQVPIMLECFDLFFSTVEAEQRGGLLTLDFSEPGLHRYTKSQTSFHFPSIPEDDVMDAYTYRHMPKPGDVVWDVGAHAGATTYFLSQMVGPEGRVYAFEPDDLNYEYLLRNIELHQLQNVSAIKKALAGSTGTADFNMDGTMSAGLSEFLVYSDKQLFKKVPIMSLPDACNEFGETPSYIKMDIEGAEVAVVEGARDFLRSNRIHFAIESYHRIGGELTCAILERLFSEIGYEVNSSDRFVQMFTWGTPTN